MTTTKVSGDDAVGDGFDKRAYGDSDDNDGGLDNEDGECSLSTSCMMERGASLIITPRDHPVHHPYQMVHPLMDYVLLIKHSFV